MYPKIQRYIDNFKSEFNSIKSDRRLTLNNLADYIQMKLRKNQQVRLIFICTHNSRRSHMTMIWARAAAAYYKIPDTLSFSGGTESTAFHPNAVIAMQEAGFRIKKISNNKNPVYEVNYSDVSQPFPVFSKRYNHKDNPGENFCAVMTCSEADINCPLIPGAEYRISLSYDDPKDFDDTPYEEKAYRERCLQIAWEMFYVFSRIQKHE